MPHDTVLTKKTLNRAPKVRGWPWVGSLPQLSRPNLDFLLKTRARYGDVFAINFGGTELIMFAHPDHAQHILVDRFQNYADKGEPVAFRLVPTPLMGQGVAMVRGKDDSWRHQRRALQPFFQHENLDKMTDVMADTIESELRRWDAHAATENPFDVEQELVRMIVKIVGKTMFGVEIAIEEADEVSAAVRVMMDYIWQGNLKTLLPNWISMPRERDYYRAIGIVRKYVEKFVKDSSASKSEDHLLAALRRNFREFYGEEAALESFLQTEAITIFITGYESTSASLSWAFHRLTKHHDVMTKLQREVDNALARRKPTIDDIPKLPYARMVFQETLRLYPPSYWGAQRKAAEDDEIGGFHIPAGSLVTPVQYLTHHHPDVWDDPERFDPERFTSERIAQRHKLAWMPFGAGQRKCLAEEFALIKGQLILSQTLQRFEVKAVPQRPTKMRATTNLRPLDGVWVTVTRRA